MGLGPSTRVFTSKTLIDWNIVSPRSGLVYDVSGEGRTLVKASYGRYASGLSTELGFTANPNTNQPWERYRWVDDGDGQWQPGEEGEPFATRGPRERPFPKPPITREFTLSLEHELRGAVAIRSGVVWRGLRQPYARRTPTAHGAHTPVRSRSWTPDRMGYLETTMTEAI